jgi:hypothetical protein
MQRIVGTYTLDQIGMDCRIWEEAGKAMLQASAEGQIPFALQWQGSETNGGNEFRASFDSEVKLIFAEDGQSFTLYQGGNQTAASDHCADRMDRRRSRLCQRKVRHRYRGTRRVHSK